MLPRLLGLMTLVESCCTSHFSDGSPWWSLIVILLMMGSIRSRSHIALLDTDNFRTQNAATASQCRLSTGYDVLGSDFIPSNRFASGYPGIPHLGNERPHAEVRGVSSRTYFSSIKFLMLTLFLLDNRIASGRSGRKGEMGSSGIEESRNFARRRTGEHIL